MSGELLVELVGIPRDLMADFEGWLRRYGRELVRLPSGEMLVARSWVSPPARPYDQPDVGDSV